MAVACFLARARPRTPATSQKVVEVRSATTICTPGLSAAQSRSRTWSALLESTSAGSRTTAMFAGAGRLRISLGTSFSPGLSYIL